MISTSAVLLRRLTLFDDTLKNLRSGLDKGPIILKQKNYDVYLSDAKAYGAEKVRREKEYNSLIFKMRMDLKKQ